MLRCAGYNGVDLAAAKQLGFSVTRVPTYSPYAVAEHAVALLLALNRKIPRASNRVRDLNFSLNGLVGFDLHGKTAGIFGTGKIGRVAAQILRGFGMRVLAFDPFQSVDWARQYGVEYTDAGTLARESEVISLHMPLTPETRHIICRETLELMKPGVVLINVSRGALIDTTALIEALKTGRLGGVALDVYEEEEGVFFEDLSGRFCVMTNSLDCSPFPMCSSLRTRPFSPTRLWPKSRTPLSSISRRWIPVGPSSKARFSHRSSMFETQQTN